MSTTLLYHQDDYLKSFEATVQAIERDAKVVILTATAFYPTGGHQNCDQGWIQKGRRDYILVTDVQKNGCNIVEHHYEAFRGSIKPGDKVQGLIQWQRRFQHMRLHTAQHIFSSCALDRFGVKTGHADFSPDGGLAVLEDPLTWVQVFVLEDDVNRMIAEERKVTRSIDESGVVTISIDQLDSSHCGGTHVRSTAEIEMFKVTGMHNRNIYYQIGQRAKQKSIQLANSALESAALLQAREASCLPEMIHKLIIQRDEGFRKLAAWEEKITERQISMALQSAVPINDRVTVFQLNLSHVPTNDVKNLVKKQLISESQVWICLADRRNMLISSSAEVVDANEILQNFTGQWGMRGGGNFGYAQGGPVPEAIADPAAEVTKWILSMNGKYTQPSNRNEKSSEHGKRES